MSLHNWDVPQKLEMDEMKGFLAHRLVQWAAHFNLPVPTHTICAVLEDTFEQWRRKEARSELMRTGARGKKGPTSLGYLPQHPPPPAPFTDEEMPMSSWYMVSRVDKCE